MITGPELARTLTETASRVKSRVQATVPLSQLAITAGLNPPGPTLTLTDRTPAPSVTLPPPRSKP